MKIIVATGNADKMKEIREILGPSGFDICSQKEEGLSCDAEENGTTFAENALIKARNISGKYKHEDGAVVLADDSGLVIDALNGEPGIYSARYMGEDTSYHVKNAELIRRLTDVPVEKRTARLKCAGTCDACSNRYDFTGINDCFTAMQLNGGPKSCEFGCMGLGSCVAACEFDALTIENGIAHIDSEKCTGCARCASACPKNLIELVPVKHPIYVACSSTDKGALVKNYCSNGCIGCKICEKNCPSGAITVENNLAKIDYSKCTECGICAEKCPKKLITGKKEVEE